MRLKVRAMAKGMRLAATGLLVLGLGACLGGPDVPDQLLTLSAAPDASPPGPRRAAPGQAITIAEPSVPAALRTPRIPVYVDDVGIQYLKDAQWVEYPAPLFGRLVGQVVGSRTGRVVLNPDQFTHDPGLQVTGTLLLFGLDPNSMEAVVRYDAAMARGADGIVTRRFEARVPVSGAVPAEVASALNQASNQVAGEVASWIAG